MATQVIKRTKLTVTSLSRHRVRVVTSRKVPQYIQEVPCSTVLVCNGQSGTVIASVDLSWLPVLIKEIQ